MHKLLGDHKWKAKGFDFVCECGAIKKDGNSCKVFVEGEHINSDDMNHNFTTLQDVTKDLQGEIDRLHAKVSMLEGELNASKSDVSKLQHELKEVKHGR